MGRRKNKNNLLALLTVMVLSGVFLGCSIMMSPDLTADHLIRKLLWPLGRLMLFIGIGLFAGQVIEASGWTGKLAFFARPLFRYGHLGDHCSAAFTTAFLSGAAANAMLLDFYKDGRISKQQLFLTNLVNQLPAYFLHLPTTFFIVIPLTGWAGGLYFILTLGATLLRTMGFLIYGHVRIAPSRTLEKGAKSTDNENSLKRLEKKIVLKSIGRKLLPRLAGIGVFVIPIYVFIYVINAMGFFPMAQAWLARFVTTTVVPIESLSMVVLSFATEFTSGFAAAGALMDAGVLTVKQTVMALLIGNIVAFPIRALRHQLPRYMGIFSPRMGLQILLMGQGFRIFSLIIVGIVFFYIG